MSGLGDVNPPVHAWAACASTRSRETSRQAAPPFLERVFHKLLLNFTWWVNRKDAEGKNVFQGGFLGLDNIGVFDRTLRCRPAATSSSPTAPAGWRCITLNLLAMARELAMHDSAYEDVASKFWEHFIYIARAMNHLGRDNISLWNEEDGFFYDVLHLPDHAPAVARAFNGRPGALVRRRVGGRRGAGPLAGLPSAHEWFVDNRPDLVGHCAA